MNQNSDRTDQLVDGLHEDREGESNIYLTSQARVTRQ